jgi:hypothetical protein
MTLELIPGYDVRKAAHAAAFFALKQGGAINVLKLSKLLYLAERGFIEQFDAPMFYDDLASLPDGPVTSITLNLINGDLEHEEWSKIVGPRSGYNIPAQQGKVFGQNSVPGTAIGFGIGRTTQKTFLNGKTQWDRLFQSVTKSCSRT